MPRIAILNMIVGFLLIFFSASGGFFLGTEVADAFLHSPDALGGWYLSLAKSAHGHTNLFGYLHILFGLTTPYAKTSARALKIEFTGLALGSFAMSFLMVIRSFGAPEDSFSILGLTTGACLSASLVALVVRIYGLCLKYTQRC